MLAHNNFIVSIIRRTCGGCCSRTVMVLGIIRKKKFTAEYNYDPVSNRKFQKSLFNMISRQKEFLKKTLLA